jgi:large subunit ribosomal protein L23
MKRAAHQIVKRPLLTEKGTRLRESGGNAPGTVAEEDVRAKVFFEVDPDANKIEIKQAVEALFNVKVSDVHTQVVRGKERRVGRFIGRRPSWKKAIVTLAKGNKIDFFEGV